MANKKNKKRSRAGQSGKANADNIPQQQGCITQNTVAAVPVPTNGNMNAAQTSVDPFGTVAPVAGGKKNRPHHAAGQGESTPGVNPPPYEVADALGEPFTVSSSSWTGSDDPYAAVADLLVKGGSQPLAAKAQEANKGGSAVNPGSVADNNDLLTPPAPNVFTHEGNGPAAVAPPSSSTGHKVVRLNPRPTHTSPAVVGSAASADVAGEENNKFGDEASETVSSPASSAYRLQPNTPFCVFDFRPKGHVPPFGASLPRRVASEPVAGSPSNTVDDKQGLPTPTIRVTSPSPERPRYPVKRPAKFDVGSNTAPVTATTSRAASGTGNIYENLQLHMLPGDEGADGRNCCNCAESHDGDCTCACHQTEDSVHSDASTVRGDAAPAAIHHAAAGAEDVVVAPDPPSHLPHVSSIRNGQQSQPNPPVARHNEIQLDIQQPAVAVKPSESANVICLSKYLQGKMLRKIFTDFKLVLNFPHDRFATVTFSAHKIVIGRSPYLYYRLFDRQGSPQDISEIVALAGPKFQTPKAFEMALRTLYGTPVLDTDALRKYTLVACGYPADATTVDPAVVRRASTDFALCYAVSGVFFGQREVIEAGINLAKEMMSWDTLDIVTGFCENCCQYTIAPEVVVHASIEAQSLSLDGRAAAMHGSLIQELRGFWAAKLLDAMYAFVVDNTPDDFKLYPHAHVDTVFDRIPDFLRSYAPVPTATPPSDPRLAGLRFGSFAAANEHDHSVEQSSAAPSQASVMVSAVIIGLPCMLLRELLFLLRDRKEHLLHRTSLLQDIVNAREARRLRALNVLAGRLAQDPALFHNPDVQVLAWMESTQLSPLYDPDVPVNYTYWVVETEFVGLGLPPPPPPPVPAPETASSIQHGNKGQQAVNTNDTSNNHAAAAAPTATNGHA